MEHVAIPSRADFVACTWNALIPICFVTSFDLRHGDCLEGMA
ncbi:MAG: hypothetical protein QOD12_2669, partial [Verrucomicrobiota bacterium]